MSFSSEDYSAVLAEFERLSDKKYKAFNESLVPGIHTAYGVRIPELRRIAGRIIAADAEGFLAASQTNSYEGIMLRGVVIASMKTDMEARLALTAEFLPLIDNWAVCDTFCSSFTLKKQEDCRKMWSFLLPLAADEREFFARFAAVMLRGYFVTEEYIDQVLDILSGMRQPLYYVQMAVAWALADCYIKFPKQILQLLEQQSLTKFVQNKTIQKIRESYRVSREDKDFLQQLKF